jgi:glutamate-1-semialdehyde aminotransferase
VNIRENFTKSAEYIDKCRRYLPGGTHYNFAVAYSQYTSPIVKAEKSRVWDMDGNEYLDLFCKFGALIVGHKNTRYNEFLKDGIDKANSVEMAYLETEVCELLSHCIPSAERIRFGLSGTETIQAAIRLARGYTGKKRFIRFSGHYHGSADNIMGGGLSENIDYPVPCPVEGDHDDTAGRFSNSLEDQSFLLPWNNIDILKKTLDKYKDEIAAVILEPVCVNGGGVAPKENYLQQLRDICSSNNIVLIFDEVITGFRVGLHGAQGLFGIKPDLSVFGKAMAGGSLPVSALTGKKEIMELLEKRKVIQTNTFNGYTLGLVAVLATLKILMGDKECYTRTEKMLEKISSCFMKTCRELGIEASSQIWSTILTINMQNEVLKDPDDYSDELVVKNSMLNNILHDNGILCAPITRFYGNIQLNEDDVEFFTKRIGDVLTEYKKGLGSINLL